MPRKDNKTLHVSLSQNFDYCGLLFHEFFKVPHLDDLLLLQIGKMYIIASFNKIISTDYISEQP